MTTTTVLDPKAIEDALKDFTILRNSLCEEKPMHIFHGIKFKNKTHIFRLYYYGRYPSDRQLGALDPYAAGLESWPVKDSNIQFTVHRNQVLMQYQNPNVSAFLTQKEAKAIADDLGQQADLIPVLQRLYDLCFPEELRQPL